MTTTFYLLRTENAAVGDGPYFGIDADGGIKLSPTFGDANKFKTLEEAEQQASLLKEQYGKVEIEVRNSTAS